MTDLQISLIAIGGAIVIGVIGYNKLHEHRAKKNVERAFSGGQDDVLMSPSISPAMPDRHEPVFSAQEFTAQNELPAENMPVQDAPAMDDEESSAPAQIKDLPVDELIDCIIPLVLEEPVRGDKVLPLLQTLRHVGSKPVHFIGLSQSSGWQPISHGNIYTELQAGVQLANRSGALNELEYSEMVVRLRQIADDIDAEPGIPDMSSVMAAARSAYQFVSQHDARLGINVRSNGAPWEINTLLAALERQGFDVRPDGRFVMLDGDGAVLFSLTTNENVAAEYTSCLTLLLDVPRVAPLKDGFGMMLACAKLLVKRLDGTIVDDGNLALSDEVLEEIAGQVTAFYEEMQAADIPGGSPRALRLFI